MSEAIGSPRQRLAAARIDTRALLERYAARQDQADLDLLVERHLPLARGLAVRYRRVDEPVDDLVQVATVGLIKALRRFEPERGHAFTTYAVPTILGELKRSFRGSAWAVHVPRSVQERVARLADASDELWMVHGRSPSVSEVAAALGESEEDVLEAMAALASRFSVSLDAPVGHGGVERSLSDDLGGDDDGYERVEDLATIEAALPILTDAQRAVLHLRFEHDLLQSEIAGRLGVSQMQVSRLLRLAIERVQSAAAHRDHFPPPSRTEPAVGALRARRPVPARGWS